MNAVDRVEHPAALDDLALGGEVELRDLDALLGGCRSRCRARSSSTAGSTRMLWPGEHAAVVEVPDLGPLVLGIPLAELVAEREHALLGAGLLLVAPAAAEQRVEAVAAPRPRAAPASGCGCASRWAPPARGRARSRPRPRRSTSCRPSFSIQRSR